MLGISPKLAIEMTADKWYAAADYGAPSVTVTGLVTGPLSIQVSNEPRPAFNVPTDGVEIASVTADGVTFVAPGSALIRFTLAAGSVGKVLLSGSKV